MVLLRSVNSVKNLNFCHIRSLAGSCVAEIYWYVLKVCIQTHTFLFI